MGRLFGTDGVRGVANRDLTPELAQRLGRAAVGALTEAGEDRPRIVIGRDTRASGELLEAALVSGVCSAGGDVVLLGVCTTPGVAFLTRELGAAAGAVISASHNPAEDNGIKFFGPFGYKLPDALEDEVERLVAAGDGPRPVGRDLGRVMPSPEAEERYVRHLRGAVPDGALLGMRIVVDCANGAAFRTAPEVLRRLGASVAAIHREPDGWNINRDCGATSPESMAKEVQSSGADAGVAFDGDADRAIFCDAQGQIIDGDQVLAALATQMRQDGELPGDVVVSTVMANLGLRRFLAAAGIRLAEVRVGDRYVLEEMLRLGAVLGGEQSGHVILRRQATTGDGILTAVRFLSLARHREVTVAELVAPMVRFPQVLRNVPVAGTEGLENAAGIWDAVGRAEAALGESGRVLVRASGTEALVRVMVEAGTLELAEAEAERICEAVRAWQT